MLNFLLTKTPLVFFTQSFWRDEAFTYLMAKQPIGDIISTTVKDFSPPLYYIVLHFWMMLFGHSEIALRALSLVFFFATIYVVDHILVEVFHLRKSHRILSLLTLSLNPFLLYYAGEARMYTMAAFWTTLSWYGMLTGKRRLYILSSVLAVYTHYFTALHILAQFIAYRIFHRTTGYRAFVGIGVFFLPWALFTFMSHGSSDSAFWIPSPTITTIQSLPGILFTGFEQSFHTGSEWLRYFTVIGFLTSAYVAIHAVLKRDRVGTTLLLWTWVPPLVLLGVSLMKPFFLPRYFIASTVGISLITVYTFHRLPRMLALCAFVIVIIVSVQFNIDQSTQRTKADLRTTISTLKKIMNPADVLYVENELDFHTAQYYFDEQRVYIYRKDYRELPEYVGKVLIPQQYVTATLPTFPRKAYILHPNLRYDIQSVN